MAEKKRYHIALYQRANKLGPKVLIPALTLLLLLLVSQVGARLSWSLLDFVTPQPAVLYPVPSATSQAITPDSSALVPGLADLHLFGRAGRVTMAPLTDASDLPSSTLNIALTGLIFSTSPENSLAIIGPKGKGTANEIYGVGDTLPGSAVLTEIHPDRVILRRAGRYETLALEEETSSSTSTTSSKKGRVSAGSRGQIKPGGDGISWSIDRSYLNQRLADMKSLASEVGADVYQENGTQKGYRLRTSNSSGLLGQLGLQSGDVLTEVNGMPLRSVNEAMQAFAQSKNAQTVRVEIIRDGTRQTREYSIGQL